MLLQQLFQPLFVFSLHKKSLAIFKNTHFIIYMEDIRIPLNHKYLISGDGIPLAVAYNAIYGILSNEDLVINCSVFLVSTSYKRFISFISQILCSIEKRN